MFASVFCMLLLSGVAAPAAPANTAIVVQQGTAVSVRLTGNVSSKTAREGDSIQGILAVSLLDQQNHILVQDGTPVSLRVAQVVPGGRSGQPAKLTLQLVSINVNQANPTVVITNAVDKYGIVQSNAREAVVVQQGAVMTYSHFGLMGSMIGNALVNRASAPKRRNVDFHAGDLVTFYLSQKAVIDPPAAN